MTALPRTSTQQDGTFKLSGFTVPNPTATPTPENQVLCHRIQNDVCEEKELGNCDGTEWLSGGCPTATATPTPNETVTPTPTNQSTQTTSGGSDGRSDGKSDNQGCGSHDCSGTTSSSQAVLGASTGPEVLGLSSTSGDQNYLLTFIQLFGAMGMTLAGLRFFKKNA